MMMMTMGSKKCAVSRAPRPVGSNFWGERTRKLAIPVTHFALDWFATRFSLTRGVSYVLLGFF